MRVRNIVIGQKVDGSKIERARELRRSMTNAERLLWQALRKNSAGLHFRRQRVIAGFIVDFYCHSVALVVELDGPVHERQTISDTERDAILSRLGFRVLRIPNEEVSADLCSVVRKILAQARPNP